VGSYTSLICATKRVGDTASVPVLKQICEQELAMSDWLISHLPELTEQFLTLSEDPDSNAKR
jgi:Uncharacterized protein conserved in bacteria